MDIQQAKQQIKYTMQAYFAKDEFGGYALPPQRQRPIFLLQRKNRELPPVASAFVGHLQVMVGEEEAGSTM